MVVGITGGVGAGKSTVMNMISGYDFANTIDTDSLSKEIMNKDEQIKNKLKEAFGEDTVSKDGQIMYGILAKKVFGEDQLEPLELLNNIVHPVVIETIKKMISDKNKVWFIESAILVQTDLLGLCDEVWLVDARASVRIKRLVRSRGYSRARAKAMIISQRNAYSYGFDQILHNNKYSQTKRELNELIEKKFKKYIDK